jgi:two-component system chemotaxis sensor kinase CheA
MSEELQLFLEDSEEQLTLMENALVAMQESGVNEEDIGALFRAMHTIKGTAGMFGFDDVVGFAHVAESLLSEVRSGTVELTEEMLALFLLCKDHVERLVEIASQNEAVDDALREVNDDLLAKLLVLMPGDQNKPAPKAVEPEVIQESSSETGSDEDIWHVSISLNEDFFSSGMDIVNVISCLEDLGSIKKTVPVTSKVPLLKDYNPVAAYMGFEVQLQGSTSFDEIEEVFEFILDDLELVIFKTSDTKALKEFIESQDDKDKFRLFLLENELYTQANLDELEPKPEPTTVEEVKKEESTPTKTKKKAMPKKQEQKHFSLRVDSSKVDQLINQISEMVIANAKIAQRADQLDDTDLDEATTIMTDMLEDVRSSVMNIRMVQVGDSFAKFKRIVGDTSKKIGKDINFVINGGETELDKMVVEKISDPIMHMLRNSVDHGVELPEDRVANGKEAQGNVTLSAYPDAGTIVIEIRDDGKGLDRDKILAKAITNGLVPENNNLSDKEIYNLIFAAGLSTADKVSDISGRGVGMDVVKRNIEDLRGMVEIDSTPGKGSLFTIRLPLTLAIIDGFLIQSGETKYIIPLEMIQECIELSKDYKEQMHGNEFINLRDSILPLLNIREYFKEGVSQADRDNIVVVRYGEYKMGLQVDELYGEFQTVIKPLGEVFENVAGISGGTILGSGEIALIFDIPKLMEQKIKETRK